MHAKAQTTVEFLVVVAIGLIILGALVGFISNQIALLQQQQAEKTAQASITTLVTAINEVYVQGPGAVKEISLLWPSGIDTSQSRISSHSIILHVYQSDVTGTATPSITGSLPTSPGLQTVSVKAYDGFVGIGTLTLSTTPTSFYIPLSRGTTTTSNLRVHSIDSTSATVTPSLSWDNEPITLSTNTNSFSITSAADVNRDINFAANATAVGNYSGKLQLSASFSDHLESLIVPISVEINVDKNTLLNAYPSALTINSLWDDTNASTLQICNFGEVPMQSISFTPSTGNVGDWVQGINTISSLAAHACQSVSVRAIVPLGSALGTYYGNLHIQDFTGSNYVNVPLTVNVNGMSSAFLWDWNSVSRSSTALIGFGIANVGSKAITITSLSLSGWGACDSNHNTIVNLYLNSSTLFTGSAAEGVSMDINDINIPVLSYYTDNRVRFSGTVNDENEEFYATVNFSDGTTYQSSTFGSGCGVDVTPPGTATLAVADDQTGLFPGAVRLKFSLPGDDNFSGQASGYQFRVDVKPFSVDADFNTQGTALTSDLNLDFGHGDAASTIVYDVGTSDLTNIAARFWDEVPNYGSVSNSLRANGKSSFSYGNGDFNFSKMFDSNATANFIISSVGFKAGTYGTRWVTLRIVEDGYDTQDPNTAYWEADLNFDNTGGTAQLNYYHFKYKENSSFATEYFSGDTSVSLPFDLTTLADAPCTKSIYTCLNAIGDKTGIVRANHVYLDTLTGLSDFNVSFIKSAG